MRDVPVQYTVPGALAKLPTLASIFRSPTGTLHCLAPATTTHPNNTSTPIKMISRLARISGSPSQAFRRSARAVQVSQRHQSTAPRTATSHHLQNQQAATPQIAKHPSSVSHPALQDEEPRNTDNAIFLIFGGLLLVAAPLSYWYWGYRERAIKAKKEEILRGIQERYAARHGNS